MHVQSADAVYYPDLFVACGREAASSDTVVDDALLVVEVASDSTAQTDQREKRIAYLQLPGLRAYWIVQQSAMTVETWQRDEQRRITVQRASQPNDTLTLPPLEIAPIALADVYAGTDIA